jgi:tetratricopeptide (TPR) repeat protein
MPDQPLLQRGMNYLKNNNMEKAIEVFEKGTTLSPQDFRMFTYLGIAYAKSGKHNLAIGALQSAIQLRPDIASIRYNLGLVYQDDGLIELAIYQFEKALEIDPTYKLAEDALNILKKKMENEDIYSGISCARHPDEPAVGICSRCRLPMCSECKTVVDGQPICTTCNPQE